MKILHIVAFALVIIGGLNWGLVGLFNFNVVTTLLGSWPMAVQAVYVLVGLSAVLLAATHMKDCKACSK